MKRHTSQIALYLLTALIAAGCRPMILGSEPVASPDPAASPTPTPVPDTEAPVATTLSINSDTESTGSTAVTLTLAATGASQMYITQTSDCAAGGTWESYASSKAWTLANADAVNTVYVKFRDSARNVSSCISDSIVEEASVSVSSIYPTNGRNWNDYVKNDGSDVYLGTDTACEGIENGYSTCIHGGEKRKGVLSGSYTSCTGMSASDTLGAFNWVCNDNSGAGPVTFYSSGLKSTKGLADLVDATSWKNIALTVNTGSGTVTSVSRPWHNNPVGPPTANPLSTDASVTLDTESKIWTIAESTTSSGYSLDANKQALVCLSGATLTWSGSLTANWGAVRVLAPSNSYFLWYEGTFNAAGSTDTGATEQRGLQLGGAFNVIRKASINGHKTYGLLIIGVNAKSALVSLSTFSGNLFTGLHGRASYNTYSDLTFTANTPSSFLLGNTASGAVSDYNTVTNITVSGLSGATAGVNLSSSHHNTLSNITVYGCSSNSGFYMSLSNYNTVSNVTSHSNNYGAYIGNSNDNELSQFHAFNNTFGLAFAGTSTRNKLQNSSANKNQHGLNLQTGTTSNTVIGFSATNNSGYGIYLVNSNENTITQTISASNSSYGLVVLNGGNRNTLLGLTLANNALSGLLLHGTDATKTQNNNTVVSVASVNNGGAGVYLSTYSNSNLLSQIASAHNLNRGVYLINSSNNTFTGNLVLGNNPTAACTVSSGTNPGLVTTTCANNGTSNANYVGGVTLATSFAGKVTSDDSTNTSDTNGTASFPGSPSTFDWTGFTNLFRGWGKDGSAFPNSDHRGQWTSGTGRIWDWRLAAAGSVIRNTSYDGLNPNDGFTAGQTCPQAAHGNVAITDQQTTPRTFLVNAQEVISDSIGNDNGLCENNEACVYSPNFGAYQGEGTLTGACTFTNGTVTGVTLYSYPTNGS